MSGDFLAFYFYCLGYVCLSGEMNIMWQKWLSLYASGGHRDNRGHGGMLKPGCVRVIAGVVL